MYIHLIWHEPATNNEEASGGEQPGIAGPALYVREFPEDGAGVVAAVRRGAAACGTAGDAAHDSAGFGPDGRGDAGAAGGNSGDGQHEFDADAGDYAEVGMGCGAARDRQAREVAEFVEGGCGEVEGRDGCLGKSAGAIAGQAG